MGGGYRKDLTDEGGRGIILPSFPKSILLCGAVPSFLPPSCGLSHFQVTPLARRASSGLSVPVYFKQAGTGVLSDGALIWGGGKISASQPCIRSEGACCLCLHISVFKLKQSPAERVEISVKSDCRA